MNYNQLAQPFTKAQAPKAKLPTVGNPSWMYIHHPKNWDLIMIPTKNPKKGDPKHKAYWLPNLNQLIEEPGCNNVTGTKDNPDSRLARTTLIDDGYTILSPLNYDYMRVYPAHKGKYHTTKFVNIEVLGGEMITTTDRNAFNEWKKSLVADGHIAPPHPQILKRVMHKQQELIVMHGSKPHIPHAVEMHKVAEQKLQSMREAAKAVAEQGREYYE